jgi:hypothetical protein
MDLAAAVDLPAKRDDHADLTGGDDVGFSVGHLQPWLVAGAGLTTLENLTSLPRTVSARSGPPPQAAPLDAPPFEVGGQQRHERFDVASDRGVERQLDPYGIGF